MLCNEKNRDRRDETLQGLQDSKKLKIRVPKSNLRGGGVLFFASFSYLVVPKYIKPYGGFKGVPESK